MKGVSMFVNKVWLTVTSANIIFGASHAHKNSQFHMVFVILHQTLRRYGRAITFSGTRRRSRLLLTMALLPEYVPSSQMQSLATAFRSTECGQSGQQEATEAISRTRYLALRVWYLVTGSTLAHRISRFEFSFRL